MATIYCPNDIKPQYGIPTHRPEFQYGSEDFLHYLCRTCELKFVFPKYKRPNSMYMVIRDPVTSSNTAPNNIHSSIEQAIEVAKSLAKKNPGQKYYIVQLIKSAVTEPNVVLEDC